MKKQMLTLVIGILIGAIIATGVFLVLKGNSSPQANIGNMRERPSMDGDTMVEGEGTRGNRKDKTNENTNSIGSTETTETEN